MAKTIKVYWDFDLDRTDLSDLSEMLGLDEDYIENALNESEETLNEIHDAFADAVGVPVKVDLDDEDFDFKNIHYTDDDVAEILSDKYGWCIISMSKVK